MLRTHPGKLIFVLLIFLLLTLTVIPYMSIGGVRPDLFFIFIVFYAFHVSWKSVPFLAFLIGLTRDLLTNSFFGLETFSIVVASVLLSMVASKVERENPFLRYLCTFFFSACTLSLSALSFLVVAKSFEIFPFLLARTFYVSLYTVCISPFVFFLLDRTVKIRSRQYELF